MGGVLKSLTSKFAAKVFFVIAGLSLALISKVWATETITYAYDALGRLTTSAHSGSVNNGQQTTYTLDAAGNRTNTTTTGASP
jgi:YD repeat-containing protein